MVRDDGRASKGHLWWWAHLWSAVGLFVTFAVSGWTAEQPSATNPVVVVQLEGTVGSAMEVFVHRALAQAKRLGAPCVIFEIDSPGGLLDTSFDLSELLQQINWTRVVVYVPREALSGAAIVSLGCAEIYLAENARFGNAGPIFLDETGMFRHVPEKLRSDLALRMRQLAEFHNRPASLAEAFVDSELTVWQFRHKETGKTMYFSEKEWQSRDDADEWDKGPVVAESGGGRFLEVTGRRAVELGLANGIAASRQELFEKLGVQGEPVVLRISTFDYVVVFLNHPLITGLLFIIGMVALYLELSTPGIGIGGLIAALSFALFFWSRFLGGTADWLEIVLFLLGVGLLLVELLLLPGFGVFGITGLLLVATSLIMASHDFLVPQTSQQYQQLITSICVLVGSAVVVFVCAVFITHQLGRLPILHKLVLTPPTPTGVETGVHETSVDTRLSVGLIGITETPLRPGGKACFDGVYVDVVTDSEFVERGTTVEIVDIAGNRIVVRRKGSNSATTA